MKTRTTLLALAMSVALAGCTSGIKLQNPQTGAVATCGPYLMDSVGTYALAEREARCLDDFQRQGFVRAVM